MAMKAKEFWLTALAMAAIAAVSVVAYRHMARPQADLCQVCQRGLHAGVSFRLEMADGTTETACCPRCGMHFMIMNPGKARRAWATDLTSQNLISAESATYVEGGDVEYCTMHSTAVQREPQGVSVREYDRCLPTLVAFRTQTEAESYRVQHGGRILSYEGAVESVKAR